MSEHPENSSFDITRKQLLKRALKKLRKEYRKARKMQRKALASTIHRLETIYAALYGTPKKREPSAAA